MKPLRLWRRSWRPPFLTTRDGCWASSLHPMLHRGSPSFATLRCSMSHATPATSTDAPSCTVVGISHLFASVPWHVHLANHSTAILARARFHSPCACFLLASQRQRVRRRGFASCRTEAKAHLAWKRLRMHVQSSTSRRLHFHPSSHADARRMAHRDTSSRRASVLREGAASMSRLQHPAAWRGSRLATHAQVLRGHLRRRTVATSCTFSTCR